ncbi:MAG: hypothetical protein NZ658_03920, partial [Pirellulales bacterium]|nr:hypothetical protein [Pirellulales bacterium]
MSRPPGNDLPACFGHDAGQKEACCQQFADRLTTGFARLVLVGLKAVCSLNPRGIAKIEHCWTGW